MSIKSRANYLSSVTKLSYQAALQMIRRSGILPATIAKERGWPLKRADAFLYNPELDKLWPTETHEQDYITCAQANQVFQTIEYIRPRKCF